MKLETTNGRNGNHDGVAAAQTDGQEQNQSITADEVALYDRQIRLWGMEAQSRIRNAHILLVTIRALGNEIAKNLVLAGIGSLTVMDGETVTEEDLGAQFLVSQQHVGQNRAEAALPAIRRLNPRVEVHADTGKVIDEEGSARGKEFFGKFNVVIATDVDVNTLMYVNDACRESGTPFYAGSCFGLYGFIFADLIKHQYIIERDKGNLETKIQAETRTRRIVSATEKKDGLRHIEYVTKEESYVPFSEAMRCAIEKSWRPKRKRSVAVVLPALKALWTFQMSRKEIVKSNVADGNLATPSSPSRFPSASGDLKQFLSLALAAKDELGLPTDYVLDSSFVRSFLDNLPTELSPVAAILGGQLAQGVINLLSKREQPLQNILVFSGDDFSAPIYVLQPQPVAE